MDDQDVGGVEDALGEFGAPVGELGGQHVQRGLPPADFAEDRSAVHAFDVSRGRAPQR